MQIATQLSSRSRIFPKFDTRHHTSPTQATEVDQQLAESNYNAPKRSDACYKRVSIIKVLRKINKITLSTLVSCVPVPVASKLCGKRPIGWHCLGAHKLDPYYDGCDTWPFHYIMSFCDTLSFTLCQSWTRQYLYVYDPSWNNPVSCSTS